MATMPPTSKFDPRQLDLQRRATYLKESLGRALKLSSLLESGAGSYAAFSSLLKFIVESNHWGGCHDTSAVLFMLLSELNIKATLCIGEVQAGDKYFDHSWVEVDGQVFDAAVCMPHESGRFVSGPVYASTDLMTGAPSELGYGAPSGQGLDEAAKEVVGLDLMQYSALQGDLNIWILAVAMASRIGLPNQTFEHFKRRYGSTMRAFIQSNRSAL